MATIGELNVKISASIDEFEAALSGVEKGVGRLGEGLKTVGGNLTSYITLPLGLMATAAVAAYGKLDSLQRGINAITTQDLAKQGVTGFAAVQEAAVLTSERVKELQEIAKAPGIGFEQAEKGDIRLRSVGISARDSAKDLKEFANAIATSGGGASELDRVTVQLAQLSAKGKVLAQDLRPIIEAAPSVANALQDLYGTIDSEDISKILDKQGKSSSDFINVLVDELAKLPRVTGGIANELENFQQGAVQNAARLGADLDRAFNLQGLLASVSGAVDGLVNKFESLSPATQKLLFLGAVIAAATGPIVFGLGAVAAAIPPVIAGLEVLGLTSLAALGPVGIAAAAVVAAAALIITNWESLSEYFGAGGAGGSVFPNLAESIGNAVREIAGAFAALVGNNFGGLISAAGIVKALVQDIAIGFTALSDIVGGTIGAITRLLQGDFAGSLEQAKRAVVGLAEPIAGVFGYTKTKTTELKGSFQDLRAGMEEAGLAGAVMGGDIAAALGRVVGSGLLESLRDRLKEVKEARETEVSVAAINADNKLIESLQKQIDALLGVDKASKAAADALAKLRENLANNANASRALGDLYEYLPNKAKILESGIKSLTDAGFAPAGKTVQAYVAQLRAIPAAVDEAAARAVKGMEKFGQTPEFKLKLDEIPALPEALVAPPIDTSATEASLTRFQALVAGFKDSLSTNVNELSGVIANGFTGIASGIGEALANGTSLIAAAGGAILKALGDIAIKKGALLVAEGTANLFTVGLAGLGAAQIAVGGALVAAGSAAGAFGSSIGRGGASAGGYGGAASASPAATSNSPQRVQVEVVGTLRADANGLAAVLRTRDYRNGRTG